MSEISLILVLQNKNKQYSKLAHMG